VTSIARDGFEDQRSLSHWGATVMDHTCGSLDIIPTAEELISHFEEFKMIPQIAL
jgi:hypothetical protein